MNTWRHISIGTIAAACLAAATPARAQAVEAPAFHASGGYSYLQEQGIGGGRSTTYNKGWVGSVDWRVGNGPLAIVGEAGGSYRTNLGVERQSLYGFFGGVRVGLWHVGPARLFAQGLVGLERFAEPGFSEKGFAFQPGGGVDIGLTRELAFRVQGDFRVAREEGVTFKEVRVAAGAVFGFGR
jgi:hypothetical protein